ncbi:5-amino-6-(5-phosphoribosylamino)uracil reductase [Granulibacter bethesdensis]|uniref:Riboflavin biosynthesis protein RibD n=2 Tax=Granulibacter bethesdensis TaxID=364410 RepID=A0AAN0RDG1_9PROT|nr:5-amino-6-(5-phosphoribosylamino)uracil reductase [Granulibacter bethesdensis]
MSASPACTGISAMQAISRLSSADRHRQKNPMSHPDDPDLPPMRAALALAARHRGETWPNPSVGCVILREGRVVGRGVTAHGGRPHAEPQALAQAGTLAQGATAYVTLEPCCHHGHTPPCSDALIEAGIARVVVALRDPDPRVDGGGITRLREAGIEVRTGVLEEEAAWVTAGFLHRVRHGRPRVTLKLASTLDGRIATASGESQWITGAQARHHVQAVRARHDAILTGIGTVLADNPSLTCRLTGARQTPLLRLVADSRLRMPLNARMLHDGAGPVWILCADGADPARRAALEQSGVKILPIPVASETGQLIIRAALQQLGQAGLTWVLVEGGGKIAASLLREEHVDDIVWYHAPAIMGADGYPATGVLGLSTLSAMPRFRAVSTRAVGTDIVTELRRKETCSPES